MPHGHLRLVIVHKARCGGYPVSCIMLKMRENSIKLLQGTSVRSMPIAYPKLHRVKSLVVPMKTHGAKNMKNENCQVPRVPCPS